MERIHEVHGRDGHGSGSQVRGIENEERPCRRNAFGVSGNSADNLGDVMRVRGDVVVSCREGTTVSIVESPTLSLPFIETYTYLPYLCAEYPYISTQYFRSFKDAFHLSVLHQH